MLSPLTGFAQNIPDLSVAAPTGSVNTMATPPEITTGNDVNYIASYTPIVPITDASVIQSGSSANSVKQQWVFLDGFQQPFQSVTRNVGMNGSLPSHLVQLFDNRVQKDAFSFLPYGSSVDGLQLNAYQQQRDFFASRYPNEGYTSFSKTVNSSSATQRAGTTYAPGKSQIGQSRGAVTRALTNGNGEVVIWTLDGQGYPIASGYYAANQLSGVESISPLLANASQKTAPSSRTYSDKDGRLILKMMADSNYVSSANGVLEIKTGYQYTYYVYDDKGHLAYTITPKAYQYYLDYGNVVDVIYNLCFIYHYDDKERLIATHKPGEIGFTQIVYDRLDRPVMRQTPQEANDMEWEITFYDAIGRVKATSVYHDYQSLDRDSWQQVIDGGGASSPGELTFYLSTTEGQLAYPYDSNDPFSLAEYIPHNELMTVSWFDRYNDAAPAALLAECSNSLQFTEEPIAIAEILPQSSRTVGLPTGTLARVLRSPSAEAANLGDWRVSVPFYDDKGRVINQMTFTSDQTTGQGMVNLDYYGTKYDFSGRPLLSKHVTGLHNVPSPIPANPIKHTELTKFEYEATTGNLLRTVHKVDGGSWNQLAKLSYDELGRIRRNDLGNGGEVQDFSYSLRGQLTGINGVYAETGNKNSLSRTFGESLKYDYGFSLPRYDGKISGMVWRGAAPAEMYSYGYDYHQNLFLKSADFRHKSNGGNWENTVLDYSVSNLFYDKNGNIRSMTQRGVTPWGYAPVNMDVLSYNYENQSNRLQSVSDDGVPYYGAHDFKDGANDDADYEYDLNGNLTRDANKDILSFTYTRFNKPVQIIKKETGQIEYSYDATGNKLEELLISDGTGEIKRLDYIGNCVYRNNTALNGNDDSLQYIITSVGRTTYNAGASAPFREEYFVKDHLGNVRSTFNTTTLTPKLYLATYEIASANLENLIFDGLDEIRGERPGGGGDNTMAANLNGADAQRRIGSAMLLHVMAGDLVSMNVNSYFASYNEDDDAPLAPEDMLSSLVNTLSGGVNGFPGEGHDVKLVEQVFNTNNFNLVNNIVDNEFTDPTLPKAYLNYVLFDENMQVVGSMTGAFQAKGNGSWSQIGTQSALEVPQNGYLAIYLSNRSQQVSCTVCGDTYFDQLQTTITKGKLLEENHYYPFGLPIQGLSSHTVDGFKENRSRYQNNSWNTDMDLNLMDFVARQYDPQIGRFLSVDPLAAIGGQDIFSPYAAMGNEPEYMIDPMGLKYNPYSNSLMAASNTGGENGATSGSGGSGNPLAGSAFDTKKANFDPSFSYLGMSGASLNMFYQSASISMKQMIVGQYESYTFKRQQREDEQRRADEIRSMLWGGSLRGDMKSGYIFDDFIVAYNKPTYDSPSKLSDDLSPANDVFNYMGFSFGVKELMIEGGAVLRTGVAARYLQEADILFTYGAAGSKYLKFAKGAGVVGSVVTTAFSAVKVVEQFNESGAEEVIKHRDIVDGTVGVIGLATTGLAAIGLVSNPVGWGIGIGIFVYGGVTMIYDIATSND